MVDAFDFQLRTRIVYGSGVLTRLGELAHELGARRVLLVTDAGLVRAGHAARGVASLTTAGVEVRVFDRVHENPTTVHVDECLSFAVQDVPDLFVALGGGSSLDTAKGANFLLTNGGKMQDYWGIGKATKPLLPLIAVPTTAGTGSETQSFALISRADDGRKMACGDAKAAPAIALLDPELTVTQPRFVAACTGLDAITHAVETAVTTKRTPLSLVFSREAFRLAVHGFERVLAEPDDLAARGDMLRAAAFAGIAIENSMLGASHACANPLTARYDLHHGQAVGTLLPHVVRFNAADPASARAYAEIARAAELCGPETSPARAVAALIERLQALLRAAGVPRGLVECGVDPDALPSLALDAAEQWTGRFNPRPVGAAECEALYRAAL
jgi:alcohol dehydrogenase